MSESKSMSVEEFLVAFNDGEEHSISLCLVKTQDGHDYLVCRDLGGQCVSVSMTHAVGCQRCQSAQGTH